MVRSLTAVMLCFALVFAPTSSWAQANDGATSRSGGPRKQVTVIIFAGLAGAILGLSTLSFYGRPQDKLANIPVGAAIGIIIGATYSTYRAASEGRNFYDNPPPDTRWHQPESWMLAEKSLPTSPPPVLGTGWQWSF